MSFVIAAPAYVQAAATDLANIGSTISAANSAVEAPTTAILAAGADSVSAQLAALFGLHGQMYQALSNQAAQFHSQFVELMNAGGAQYALAESANASPLAGVESQALGALSAPVAAATALPLAVSGANGAGGVTAGATGGEAGWLSGNGGKGAAWAAIPGGAAVAGGGPGSLGGKGFSGGLLSGSVGAAAVGAVAPSGAFPIATGGEVAGWDGLGSAGLLPGLAAPCANTGNGGGGLPATSRGAHSVANTGKAVAGGGKVDGGVGARSVTALMDTPSPQSADWSGARTSRDRSPG